MLAIAGVLGALAGAMPGPVAAQAQRPSAVTAGGASPTGPVPDAERAATATQDAPTSTETGQSPLRDSFERRLPAAWVDEMRRKAWRDTVVDLQIRSFSLDRDSYDDSKSEAWVLGGSLGFKTGYFGERFALGATGYTSQRLHGPADKDGTLLLKPGQHGFTVLGELYGEVLLDEHVRLGFGRRRFESPYINGADNRQVPNTFRGILLQGIQGGGDGEPEWRFGGGYMDRIKLRNSDSFISMATAAGAPDGIKRGVYLAGANYRNGEFSIGAVGYRSNDLLDIFHAEARHGLPLGDGRHLRVSLQYSRQESNGDDLLLDSGETSWKWGGKAELAVGNALFTTVYTKAGGDVDMQSPWGAHPGYTTVQVEDFKRAGEGAWMLRAAYNFRSVPGLSAYALRVDGSTPDAPGQYAKEEVDLNLQWAPVGGLFEGLALRLRYGRVEQDDPGNSSIDDVRVSLFYDVSLR